MNGNGIPEVIVKMSHTQVINLVLHYHDGKVFGHDFVFRSMGHIKTDGTFINSFGGSSGVARLDFNEGEIVYEFVFQSQYQIDFYEQDVKDDVIWHPLTADNITKLEMLFTMVNCIYEQEQAPDLSDTDSFSQMYIHWDDGITQFGSRVEGNNLILYETKNSGLELVQLAVFPSLNVEQGHADTKWCRPQHIFYLDVIDDWVILSVGEIQERMHNFYGDLHRVRRDGSGREAFGLGSKNPRFNIIDGWIYHEIWNGQGPGWGWIRVRPDGTGKELLGHNIYTIILFGEDGYIYGTHAVSGRGNLARWRAGSNEPIVLFFAENAPEFEGYNISPVLYEDIVIADEYVLFTISITAWEDEYIDGWYTVWFDLYSAVYRVDKDGKNLTLLFED